MGEIQDNRNVMRQAIEKQLNDYFLRVFELSQQNLIDADKIDTSKLFISANINIDGDIKTIVYPAPYAEYVHDGRLQGTMPPIEPIQEWVKRKLGIKNEQESKSVAWKIAKSIEQRGIKESPFLHNAIQQANREFNLSYQLERL